MKSILFKTNYIHFLSGNMAFSILFGLIITISCFAESNDKKNRNYYKLFASGDTVLARRIHYYYYDRGPQWFLSELKQVVSDSDIAMTNLETVISTQGTMFAKGERNPYYFRGRPELLDIITSVGFDFVTTGNNHTMDYGPDALKQQNEILSVCGISYAGSGSNYQEASQPTFIKVDDVVVGFISMYVGGAKIGADRDSAGVFQAKSDKDVIALVSRSYEIAQKHANLVVFSPHWGANMSENPNASRINLAHKLIDMGFDLIIGHSAHQIHGIEVYKKKFIIYDMGNFIADWVTSDRMRLSAAWLLDFNKKSFTRLEIIPLALNSGAARIASVQDIDKTKDLVVRLSKKINKNIDFKTEGNSLVVDLLSDTLVQKPLILPEKYHITNTTRAVPEKYKNLKSNVELDSSPSWATMTVPVKLEHGIEIIGVKTVETVHAGSAFLLEVALKVGGPLEGRWEAVVYVTRKDGTDGFVYEHPVSHGATEPKHWTKGQIVLDKIVVRARKTVKPGEYDVHWTMLNRVTNDRLGVLTGKPGREIFSKISTIIVKKGEVSRLASGIEWDGKKN